MARKTRNRFCFRVLAAFMVLSVVFAGFFVCAGLGHDCAGEDCQICLQLSAARSLFEGLFLAVLLAGFAVTGKNSFVKSPPLLYAAFLTPVSLKIKYNS